MCLAQHVAIAVALALTGSVAAAAPRHKPKPTKKVKKSKVEHRDERPDDALVGTVDPAVEIDAEDVDDVDDEATRRIDRAAHTRAERVRRATDDDDEDDADDKDDADDGDDDAADDNDDAAADDDADASDGRKRVARAGDAREVDEVEIAVTKRARRANEWTVAVGPYFWLSSVDAKVSFGETSVGAGVDFFDITRHAKYGAELLAEARYGRWSLATDAMYGVIGLAANKEVGPLMVGLDGTASSLLVDGNLGFRLAGGDHAWFSVEARGGLRYQRIAISGKVNVAGAEVVDTTHSDYGADALAGVRASLRPWRRLSLSGTYDRSVAGMSTETWSASADANVRITSHVLLSAGYRTLLIDRAHVAITMHGPRFSLQFLF